MALYFMNTSLAANTDTKSSCYCIQYCSLPLNKITLFPKLHMGYSSPSVIVLVHHFTFLHKKFHSIQWCTGGDMIAFVSESTHLVDIASLKLVTISRSSRRRRTTTTSKTRDEQYYVVLDIDECEHPGEVRCRFSRNQTNYCSNLSPGYYCHCHRGWTGKHCETSTWSLERSATLF